MELLWTQASPSKLPAASTIERNGDGAEAGVQEVPGKSIVCDTLFSSRPFSHCLHVFVVLFGYIY